jgi:HD-GYP domain-containing protein (c-di-GMP phosphodiesterase class II)
MTIQSEKGLSQSNIQNFQPIKLTDLRNPVTRFDLYLDIAGRAVLYAPGPYRWSDAEKSRLLNDGHVVLFYDPSSAEEVCDYLHSATESVPAPEPAWSQKDDDEALSMPVSDLAAEFSQLLYQMPVPQEELFHVKNLAHSLVQKVIEFPPAVYHLSKLAHHDSFSFYHSARVAAYATMVAQTMGCHNEEDLADIALGCLLHDLGHLRIDRQILEKDGKLSEREWELMRQHPLWSQEMVEGFDLSFVTSEIIVHHHEREDGQGYPHGISGNELLREVKIVTVCDVFDALTSARPYQQARSPQQAVEFMSQVAFDFLDQDVLKALSQLVMNMDASKCKTA